MTILGIDDQGLSLLFASAPNDGSNKVSVRIFVHLGYNSQPIPQSSNV